MTFTRDETGAEFLRDELAHGTDVAQRMHREEMRQPKCVLWVNGVPIDLSDDAPENFLTKPNPTTNLTTGE